jgi:pimeloyl-ACP methyl ester carboxylesterase
MPTTRINDINVRYETQGEGEPLLLIAGLGSGVSLFARSIPILSKGRKVIAFDNRGAGRTDKPDVPYTIEMMADDAAGLLKALDIERADVLGVSMGGRIAMDLAIRHPEMVRGLILVSTSARVTNESRASLGLRLGKLSKVITGSGAFGRSPQPYYAFVHQLEATRKFDCTDRLGEIGAPTLLMRGDRDTLAPKNLVEEVHLRIEGSKLVEFKGGHIFFLWENKKFTDAVSEFLLGLG